jgi:hypothetical protein
MKNKLTAKKVGVSTLALLCGLSLGLTDAAASKDSEILKSSPEDSHVYSLAQKTEAKPSKTCNIKGPKLIVSFEDLALPQNSFYNGSDGAGSFTSQCTFFNNNYNTEFKSWSGWSYSNKMDTTTPGFANQYSSIVGMGSNSPTYGVAYTFKPGDAFIKLPTGYSPKSMEITNTSYAALSMRNGDQFAKKFGGATGNDPDFFLLTIIGLDTQGKETGKVEFYLADYRFSDNAKDYIVKTWQKVNLSRLRGATKLSFSLTSSDSNPQFGLNTPAYFAIDNLILRRD